uniref:Uncharacterized protein n=1 Tax=Anguilla anguilla TaxID=7936 RepID=A0A0E9WW33_ANGAN
MFPGMLTCESCTRLNPFDGTIQMITKWMLFTCRVLRFEVKCLSRFGAVCYHSPDQYGLLVLQEYMCKIVLCTINIKFELLDILKWQTCRKC